MLPALPKARQKQKQAISRGHLSLGRKVQPVVLQTVILWLGELQLRVALSAACDCAESRSQGAWRPCSSHSLTSRQLHSRVGYGCCACCSKYSWMGVFFAVRAMILAEE